MILGFVGKNAAGKTVACKHLEAQRFTYFSLSDVLREEATKQGKGHDRENLIAFGTQMREEQGVGFLASCINDKINLLDERKAVVDSIRSPGEIEELKKNDDFHLIGIEADSKTRFERMQKRGRAGDATTFKQFQELEAKENTTNKNAQQLDSCMGMVDIAVENTSSLEELYPKIDELVRLYE